MMVYGTGHHAFWSRSGSHIFIFAHFIYSDAAQAALTFDHHSLPHEKHLNLSLTWLYLRVLESNQMKIICVHKDKQPKGKKTNAFKNLENFELSFKSWVVIKAVSFQPMPLKPFQSGHFSLYKRLEAIKF